MTLNLLQIAPQIGAMAREVGERRHAQARRRDAALSLLRTWDGRLDELRLLVQQAQPWLVAEPLEPLLMRVSAPPLPPDLTVVATDGSGIDLDRHGLAQCYLINVGSAVITYGANPTAALTSQATLYYSDDDLYLDDDGTRVPVQGALADLKRTLAEQERLLDLARELTSSSPLLTTKVGGLPEASLSGPTGGEARFPDPSGREAHFPNPSGGEWWGATRPTTLPPTTPPPSRGEGGQGDGENHPLVAVLDGTLLLWQLSGRAAEERFVAEAIERYAANLLEFKRLGVPVCSYVSRPNGHEVVNLLRLAACPDGGDALNPQLPLSCGGDAPAPQLPLFDDGRGGAACCVGGRCVRDLLAPLPDRAVLGHLRDGDRSARFASRSPVLHYYGADAGITFVYLNTGDEIARIEMPSWVGDDPAMLDLVHAAIYDGCRRGWGYPPALAEAHEQAVIRGGEREAFLHMVMEALNEAEHEVQWSNKRLSKNRRAV